MTWSLRSGTSDDVGAVLDLWRRAGAEPSHTDDASSLLALLARDPGTLIVVEDDGLVVGSVVAAWDGWRGSIYRLAVAQSHRRQGLATALLGAAEERLTAAGAKRLQAIVVETDDRAVGFWSASGWERQVERLRYVSG